MFCQGIPPSFAPSPSFYMDGRTGGQLLLRVFPGQKAAEGLAQKGELGWLQSVSLLAIIKLVRP